MGYKVKIQKIERATNKEYGLIARLPRNNPS